MHILTKLTNSFFKNHNSMQKYTQEQLKARLTPLQYQVTQLSGTQPPYKNEYNKTNSPGMYNCIVCSKPLFTSDYKYDSGCGWPAFYDELKEAKITKIQDNSHGMVRTEVRCSDCNSHLGHIFEDGPQDKTGVRYCINSASLDFKKKQ